MNLKEFFVKLGLDAEWAEFTRAELAVHLIEKAFEALKEIGEKVVDFLPELVDHIAETSEQLEHASMETGVSTEKLQELGYAGRIAGVSMEEMTQSMALLSRHLAEAKKGSEQASSALKGIEFKDANGNLLGFDDVLGNIADKFQKMPDGPEKLAIAMQLFGRAGKRMIPILDGGRAKMHELSEQAHELGVVLDEDTIKQGVEYVHASKRMSAAIEGVGKAIGGPLIESFTAAKEAVTKWILAHRELIATIAHKAFTVFKTVLTVVYHVLLAVWNVIRGVIFVVTKLVEWFFSAGKVAGILLTAMTALIAAMVLFGVESTAAAIKSAAAWALAAAPLIIIASLVALAYLLIQDFIVGLNGGQSAIFMLFKQWQSFLEDWMKPKEGDGFLITQLKHAVFMLDAMITKWDEFKSDFLSTNGLDTYLKTTGQNFGPKGDMTADEAVEYYQSHPAAKPVHRTPAPLDSDFDLTKSITNHNSVEINVHAPNGDANNIADTISRKLGEFFDTKMREAAAR